MTYDELDKVIGDGPECKVISTGDIVIAITHDESGVICEDDYGVIDYSHNELQLFVVNKD